MASNVSGTTERSFRAAARRIMAAIPQMEKRVTVRVIGEEIMTDVKASRPGAGVPRDKGVLASTGQVDGPDDNGTVELSFGGAAAPYALEQHERLDFHHKLGESRYLVRGVERWRPGGSAGLAALQEQAAAAIAAAARRA